jgi:hypothetical protein
MVLGQLFRIPVLSSAVKTAPLLGIDIAVFIVWLATLVHLALRSGAAVGGPVTLSVVAFTLWALIGNILTTVRYGLSVSQFIFSTAYLVRWLYYFGVYLWARNRFSGFERLQNGPKFLRVAILIFASFGILQSAFLPDFAFILHPDAVPYVTWDPQGHRLVSTLLDPNLAGNLIGIGFLLTLPAALRRQRFLEFSSFVFLIAILLTASRGAILGLFAGGVALVVALRPPAIGRLAGRLVVACSLAIAVSSVVSWITGTSGIVSATGDFLRNYNKLSLIDPSALTRVLQWKTDLDVIAAHPLTGIGFNTWGFVQRYFGFYRVDTAAFGMDGGLLVIAALTGVVGLVLFLRIVMVPLVHGFRLARGRRLPEWARDLGASVVGCTVLWVVHGFFAATLSYPFLLVAMWLLWAWTDTTWGTFFGPTTFPNRANELGNRGSLSEERI